MIGYSIPEGNNPEFKPTPLIMTPGMIAIICKWTDKEIQALQINPGELRQLNKQWNA